MLNDVYFRSSIQLETLIKKSVEDSSVGKNSSLDDWYYVDRLQELLYSGEFYWAHLGLIIHQFKCGEFSNTIDNSLPSRSLSIWTSGDDEISSSPGQNLFSKNWKDIGTHICFCLCQLANKSLPKRNLSEKIFVNLVLNSKMKVEEKAIEELISSAAFNRHYLNLWGELNILDTKSVSYELLNDEQNCIVRFCLKSIFYDAENYCVRLFFAP